MRRIGLVGCVGKKAESRQAAKDLYVSPLFRLRRSYVERRCPDGWWILSALHGLVHPDDPLEPYDVTLKGLSGAARHRWGEQILTEIAKRVRPSKGDSFEIHAGAEYRDFGLVSGLKAQGFVVSNPTEGLRLGEQLRFYKQALDARCE